MRCANSTNTRCAYLFPIIMTLMVVLSVIMLPFSCCCCFFLHCFYLKIKGTSPDCRISSSASSRRWLVWYYYDTNTHTYTHTQFNPVKQSNRTKELECTKCDENEMVCVVMSKPNDWHFVYHAKIWFHVSVFVFSPVII